MPTSIIALQILLILLPGFAAAYVVQTLALRASQTDFDKFVEACLYSLVIYVVFTVCDRGRLPFEMVAAKGPGIEATTHWYPDRLAGLFAITGVVAVLATLYVNRDGNRLFRRVHLTERTSRRSIWNDILQSEAKLGQVVQVQLADERSVLGILLYYSDSVEEASVFLQQASWVSTDGDATRIPGAGILLTKNATITSISLLDN